MAKMTTTPKDEVKPKCAMCGMPYHRYSPDDPQHEYDAIACVNMLIGENAQLRAALYNAHSALLHARKYLQPVEPNVLALVLDALDQTALVLDYGRDEK